MNTVAVLINPASGGGAGATVWQEMQHGLNALFDKVEYRITNHHDDISLIVENLLKETPSYFIVIGGDGTLHHAINGYMQGTHQIQKKTLFAYYNAGSGGDFSRQFPKQNPMKFLESLKKNVSINTDLGILTDNDRFKRYFINVASCGFSSAVVLSTMRHTWMKRLGGMLYYLINAVITLCSYRHITLNLEINQNNQLSEQETFLLACCNGGYFGSNMKVAPLAKVNDGLLDMVLFKKFNCLQAMMKLFRIYRGTHLSMTKVHYEQVKTLSIHSKAKFGVEADGEYMGDFSSITFSMHDAQLNIII